MDYVLIITTRLQLYKTDKKLPGVSETGVQVSVLLLLIWPFKMGDTPVPLGSLYKPSSTPIRLNVSLHHTFACIDRLSF